MGYVKALQRFGCTSCGSGLMISSTVGDVTVEGCRKKGFRAHTLRLA